MSRLTEESLRQALERLDFFPCRCKCLWMPYDVAAYDKVRDYALTTKPRYGSRRWRGRYIFHAPPRARAPQERSLFT